MKKELAVSSALLSCLGLAGCRNETSWSVEGSCNNKSNCSITGKIGGAFGGGGEPLPLYGCVLAAAATEIADAALFELDLGGSSFTYPSNGQVTLTLTDSASGAVTAARQFAWARSGNVLKLSDPNAVDSWASSEGGTTTEIGYTLGHVHVDALLGDNVISIISRYQGQQTAASVSFFNVCTKDPSPYSCAEI